MVVRSSVWVLVVAIGGSAIGSARAGMDYAPADITFTPTIVAGGGSFTGWDPPDSPEQRVDANTTSSPFAGVGSIWITKGDSNYIATATPISDRHLLSAAHAVDIDGNGVSDADSVTFVLNYGSDISHQIAASSWTIHPDFTGFTGSNHVDDMLIIELASPLPAGVPLYELRSTPVGAGTTFTMVGYGKSGYGDIGWTVDPSFSVKRVGYNNADQFFEGAREWRYDYDGPDGDGFMGGPTLGNLVETALGPGDSGGPGFVEIDGEHLLAATNTFAFGPNPLWTTSTRATGGGGMLVYPYLTWINSEIPEPGSAVIMLLAGGWLLGARARRRAA